MLGPWIKTNWKWSNSRWQEWMNIDILGISKLTWTGIGKFNSDEQSIHYWGQESLRRNGLTLIVNKRVQNAVLGCNLKNDRMIFVSFQDKPFKTVIQVYAPTINAKEAEVEWFYDDLQDLLELTSKKDVLFIIGCWNAKVGSQGILGLTGKLSLGVKNEIGQRLRVLPRECTDHSKHPPTTQETTLNMDITRWSVLLPISDWVYSLHLKMEKLYTVSKNKTKSWMWLRSWTPYCKIQT